MFLIVVVFLFVGAHFEWLHVIVSSSGFNFNFDPPSPYIYTLYTYIFFLLQV